MVDFDRAEVPEWRSHKKVRAAKITVEETFAGGARALWGLDCGGFVEVSGELSDRVPNDSDAVGGYYVRYEDGFESWSPAKAFEEGYTRI